MNMRIHLFLAVCIMLSVSACKNKSDADKILQQYNEAHRPQYHFSPPEHWMNDPNGMVYYDGEYHLFYQYYPDGNTWGPMHWGHAISKDMVVWENHPIALYPDTLGYIFSGSAVVDWKNTSGFGKNGNPPMVAIYTYHSMEGEKAGKIDYQNQGIAFSNDKGRTWEKYTGNPVLKNPGIKDFRDPKVIWHEGSQSWVMTLAVKDKISFYTSSNLKDWSFASDFNPTWAAYGGVWECPDLFPIKTQDGIDKWALLVSINPGAPNGGSGTQYFIGNFDGKKFMSETTEVKWLDYGADNYAGVTWSDIPETDGRRLFIGWMSNWQYAQQVPTEVWRSAMTVPRALALIEADGQYSLHSQPIKELNQLRTSSEQVRASKFDLKSDKIELECYTGSGDFKLIFSNDKNEEIVLEKQGDKIIFDRSKSGITTFNENFPKVHTSPVDDIDIKNVRIFLDRSSIEIFFNEGALVLTELVFPTVPYTTVETQGLGDEVMIHQLKSVWNQ